MTYARLFLMPLYMAGLLLLKGCGNDHEISYQNIHIEGAMYVYNLSTSYGSFGTFVELPEDGNVGLPVADGDLLYLVGADDSEVYYRYASDDGDHLVFTIDTAGALSARINESLAFFELSNQPEALDRFRAFAHSELNQPFTLYLPDSISRDILDALRMKGTSIQGTGLMLDEVREGEYWKELLSICRPGWLILNGQSEWVGSANGNDLANLELLLLSDEIFPFTSMIPCCSNLRSLIVIEWEPARGELLPLSGMKSLRSLTLAGGGMTNLSGIEFPESLERLHLIDCKGLTDISGVQQLSNLKSLSLSGSNEIESLSGIRDLYNLVWLSFPENTTQEEFEELVSLCAGMEVIELLNCPGVTDVSPMSRLESLKTFIYNAEAYDLEQLSELQQLELLVINSSMFDESPGEIASLRALLPQTEIVPGTALCLGSGWLILLLPLVLFFRMLLRNSRKSSSSR